MSKIKASRGDRIFNAVVHVIIALIVLTVVYPLVYVLSCSFSSPSMVGSGKVWLLPKGLTLIGYERVFKDSMIVRGYANTIGYTIVGTLINLIVTMPCGYALSKKTLPGRGVFMAFFMFIMYFSGGMIPTFLLVNSLRLYNTRAILVILGAFSTYNCIICRTAIQAVPESLTESAYLDGANDLIIVFRITLPLIMPTIAVLLLYYGVGHWNAWFPASIYLQDNNKLPIQNIMRSILIANSDLLNASGSETDKVDDFAETIKYATIVLTTVPVLCIYPFLQKYFVKGVMIGAVKG